MDISVVTIALNDCSRISRTLEGIRRQSRRPEEYCIIDGGSVDGTMGLIEKSLDIVSTVTSEKDNGIYDAMNKGIRSTSGICIGIVNAGDFYFNGTLEAVAGIMNDTDADIVHGDQMVFYSYRNFTHFRIQRPDPDIAQLESKPTIFHPTCFVRRSLYERIGLFDTRYRIDADYEFLLRAKRAGATFQYIPKLLTGFEAGGVSGGCRRFSEGYRILKEYRIPRYTSNTMKLIKCLGMSFVSRFIDIEGKLEKKRLLES
ncbi:MAG: glycosyltransferase [Bacteroidetes bacterium]|nr:glycosyltransferase [Bacteroidota bacterium]